MFYRSCVPLKHPTSGTSTIFHVKLNMYNYSVYFLCTCLPCSVVVAECKVPMFLKTFMFVRVCLVVGLLALGNGIPGGSSW